MQQQSQNIQKTAKISEFLSVCTQLAFESSKIINNIQNSDSKNIKMKDIDDPMTEADIKAQTLIIKGLRKFWPNLNIVGEEDVEFQGDLGFDVNNLNTQMLSQDLFIKGIDQNNQNFNINNEFEIEKAIVWVDPLDGTLSYVHNELDCVTTLIGISYDSQPLMGIIGQPYSMLENGSFEFNPNVYFGHTQSRQVYKINSKEAQINENYNKIVTPQIHELIKRPANQDGSPQIIASTSKNHNSEEKLNLIKSLNPDKILQYGGAGKKCIDVIKGITDYTIYIGKGTKKWDTCAGEALVGCLGGVLSGTDGSSYVYKQEQEFHQNLNGMVACLNRDLHQKVINQTKIFKN